MNRKYTVIIISQVYVINLGKLGTQNWESRNISGTVQHSPNILVIICMALRDFVYLGLTAAAITPSPYVISQDPYAVGIPIAG